MESGYWVLVGVAALLNYGFAFMLSIEINELEILPTSSKAKWLILAWLVPVVGPIYTHKKLNIGWATSDSSGGSSIQPPGDGV